MLSKSASSKYILVSLNFLGGFGNGGTTKPPFIPSPSVRFQQNSSDSAVFILATNK